MRICNEEESTIIPYLYFHLPFLYFLDIRDDRTVAEQPIRMCIHMRFCVKLLLKILSFTVIVHLFTEQMCQVCNF